MPHFPGKKNNKNMTGKIVNIFFPHGVATTQKLNMQLRYYVNEAVETATASFYHWTSTFLPSHVTLCFFYQEVNRFQSFYAKHSSNKRYESTHKPVRLKRCKRDSNGRQKCVSIVNGVLHTSDTPNRGRERETK